MLIDVRDLVARDTGDDLTNGLTFLTSGVSRDMRLLLDLFLH